MKEPRWIGTRAALAIHERLLAEHGGAAGVRDEGLLEAALAAPRNRFVYRTGCDLFDLAAAYAFAVLRNHPFTDGNKRVALTLAGVFLALNGRRLDASEHDAVRAVYALSEKRTSERRFAAWLRASSHRARRPGARGR